jgi:hypothetical protein
MSNPDQIRSEIERTQQELSADVDALTEKLSPPKIVERRVQATRETITNVKDKIMGSTGQGASNAWDRAGSGTAGVGQTITAGTSAARDSAASAASSAAGAARSAPDRLRRQAAGNPLAAGLIAFGAGWLISSLLPASDPEQQVATQVKDFATEQGRPVVQQLGEAGQQAAQQLKESAQQRAQSVKDTATDAASTVSDEAQSAASQVTSQAQDAAGTVRAQAGPSGG